MNWFGKLAMAGTGVFGVYESIRHFSEGKVLEGLAYTAGTGLALILENKTFSANNYSRRLWIDEPDPVDKYGRKIPMMRVNLFWKVPSRGRFRDRIPVHTGAYGTQWVDGIDTIYSDQDCIRALHEMEEIMAKEGFYLREESRNKNGLTKL